MMGNYSIGNLFTKEPVVIAGAIRSVLWVLILLSVIAMDEKQLAAVGLALEVVLGLFTRSTTTPTTAPVLAVGTPANAGSAVVASVVPPPEPLAELGEGDPRIPGG